jgi:hypothetical protein
MLLVLIIVSLALYIILTYYGVIQGQIGGNAEPKNEPGRFTVRITDKELGPLIQAETLEPSYAPPTAQQVEKLGTEYASKIAQRPELTQAYVKSLPHLSKVGPIAQENAMKAMKAAKPSIDKAAPHMKKAWGVAAPHLMQARPHLETALNQSMPHVIDTYNRSENDLTKAWIASSPHLARELIALSRVVDKQDVKIGNSKKRLEKISRKLDQKGELNEQEHQTLQETAIKVNNVQNMVEEAEKIIKVQKKDVLAQVKEVQEDEEVVKTLQAEVQLNIPETPDSDEEEEDDPWMQVKKQHQKKLQHRKQATKMVQVIGQEAEHKVIRIKDHVKLTKDVLGNHNDRLNKLEGHLCQLKGIMNTSQALLTNIKGKLENSVQESSTHASALSPQHQQAKKSMVRQTTRTIKANCPVCPMYAQTHPVGVLEVTNQGFGSIAPANLN